MTTAYDFSANSLDGQPVQLRDYAGKVLLVVNTASKCGFTPQYEGLEALYEQYRDRGLAVLGFPCNQFGAQEPGSADEIGSFCQKNYGVSFPMFEKIDVNGDSAHPLYRWLKSNAKGLLGLASWAGVEGEREENGRREKTFREDDRLMHEEWDSNASHGQYTVVVGDRFTVKIEGGAGSVAELREAAEQLDLDGLADLRTEGVKN